MNIREHQFRTPQKLPSDVTPKKPDTAGPVLSKLPGLANDWGSQRPLAVIDTSRDDFQSGTRAANLPTSRKLTEWDGGHGNVVSPHGPSEPQYLAAGTTFESALAGAAALAADTLPGGGHQTHAVLQAGDGGFYVAGIGGPSGRSLFPYRNSYGNWYVWNTGDLNPKGLALRAAAGVPELKALVDADEFIDFRR